MRIAVAGAGLSGLSLCHALQEKLEATGRHAQIALFESEGRTGGKVQSIKDDGYLVEWGPNGFLNNKPDTLELCRKLGIDDLMLPSNDAARKRYIYAGGELHRLPESPPSFLKSRLLPWSAKFRLMGELFIPPAPPDNDQTLAEFARRRLGPMALERLIGPMASGVFGGDPETMSLKSCFPRIHELEQEYGGLFKAMIMLANKKRKEKKAGGEASGPAGPGGVLTSFDGGLEVLTRALQAAFKGDLLLDCPVTKVEAKPGGGFIIHAGASGTPVEADVFITAAPSYAASRFLAPVDIAIPETLDKIPYAPMAIVCFGLTEDDLGVELDGFGFLVGLKERRKVLGTLWDSSIFPGRAPVGKCSLRSMAGGGRDIETPYLPEEDIARIVKNDLEDIMGLHTEPEFVKVFRHEQAIPQYIVGHSRNLERLDGMEAKYPGLFFAGNAYRGVGINDCVREAYRVAEKVLGGK
ncbi:MAG: protoporphyrinogen oxidase [Nitrospirae bacterium]|nr:protoporphyrinogen oxidase [Nitrospirota bacterium]